MPAYLVRNRILKLCAVIALIVACGCLNSVESGNKTVRPASCSECHSLAASKLCDTTTVTYKGETTTRCSFCHAGSVRSDSTLNDSSNAQVYHDRMMTAENGSLPMTGGDHANGTVDLEFSKCDICHDFPPRLTNNPGAQYAHNTHVLLEQMQCFDCHVTSVQCSIDRHPDPSNPLDTVDTLVQIMRTGIGGVLVPVANDHAHLNNKVDISFRKRVEDSINHGDTFDRNSYLWDGFEKKSHNMKGCACHTW